MRNLASPTTEKAEIRVRRVLRHARRSPKRRYHFRRYFRHRRRSKIFRPSTVVVVAVPAPVVLAYAWFADSGTRL